MDTRRDFVYVADLSTSSMKAVDGAGRQGAYHVSSGGDFAIKELFDATIAALGIEPATSRRGPPARRGRRLHDPARPIGHEPRLRLGDQRRRSRRACGGRSPTTSEYGITETYTHLKLDAPPRLMARGRLQGHQRPRRRRGRLRRQQPRPGPGRRRAPRGSWSSTTSSPPSGRTSSTSRRCEFIEASITDDDVLDRARGRASTTSSTWRPTTATRARCTIPLADHEQQHPDVAQAVRAPHELPEPGAGRLLVGGLHGRREDVWRRATDDRGRPGLASPGLPVPDLQDRRRVLRQLLPRAGTACRSSSPASRTSTDPARSWAPAAGEARRRRSGGTSPRRSSTGPSRVCRSPSRTSGRSSRDFIYVDDIVRGLMPVRPSRRGRRGLQPGERRRDDDPRARRSDQRAASSLRPTIELAPRRAWDHSGNRLGSTEKARLALGFEAGVRLQDGIRRTVDWTKAKSRRDRWHDRAT